MSITIGSFSTDMRVDLVRFLNGTEPTLHDLKKFSQQYLENFYILPEKHIKVALIGSKIAGCIILAKVEQSIVVILINKGENIEIEEQLLEAAIYQAKGEECKRIRISLLESAKEAIAFYKKKGFKQIFKYLNYISPDEFPVRSAVKFDKFQLQRIESPNGINLLREAYNKSYNIRYGGYSTEITTDEINFLTKVYDKNGFFLIIDKTDHRPIGFAICNVKKGEEKSGEIVEFGVVPEYRGRGVGQYLFELCLDYFKHNEIKSIKLEVIDQNTNAVRFWEKQGFKQNPLHLVTLQRKVD